ncbi:MAG: integrase, partial [Myxococcales bacterium]|nr:integrase [Myxococcales bacterium]
MATIRKRTGRYHVQIRKNGYPAVTQTFTSITAAKKWVKAAESDMERRLFQPVSDITVGEILNRYQRTILPKHRGGSRHEPYRIRHLKLAFGKLSISDLTPSHVARYRDTRLAAVTMATVRRELVILRSALNIAMKDWGVSLPSNPVSQISLQKADKARTRRLEAGEEQKLVFGWNAEVGRIIVLALETGMRRGEILGVKKSHIDFSLRTLFIPSTKTDSPRTVPLSSAAINALRAQLRASQRHSGGVISLHEPPLFSYTPRGLSGAFLKLCRKTGIDDLHFHDLRHEATSRLFEKGLNPVEVATITGHKDT